MTSFYNLPSDEVSTNYISGQVAVTTTPTLICQVEGNETGTMINNGSGAIVYLGGPNVTTTTGFPLAISSTIMVPTYGGANVKLYGVVASTGTTVSFLHPTA